MVALAILSRRTGTLIGGFIMTRVARQRQWSDAACFHILSRGHNRDVVFDDDEDRTAFLHLVARYRQRLAFRLYHYCLMSNHFHLLVQLSVPRQLSPFMAGLLRSYVHHYHRRHQYVGHLWQGRFKSPAIRREGYWVSCGRYIERNPLDAGLVGLPWTYRWSSAAVYALGQANALVDENPCCGELAATVQRGQALWQDFLLGEEEPEEEVRQADWVVGQESFRGGIGQQRGRPRRRVGRPAKELAE